MTKGEALARVMDDAARRVLSGAERPYVVAGETASTLIYFGDEESSPASVDAYLLWTEITDLLDAPRELGGPGSEELCDAVASELSRAWLALTNREDESVQADFTARFDKVFDERLSEYRATH